MKITGGNNVVVLNYFVKLPYKISVEISLRIPEPFLKKSEKKFPKNLLSGVLDL